jgi:ribosomal protein S18 acetylase RimI-like enzyme
MEYTAMTSIRPLLARDREPLLALVRAQDNFNAQEQAVAMEVIDEALDPAKNDYSVLIAATETDAVAGFLCYGEIPLTDLRYDLYWIAVDPDKGRQGVGSLLLAAMEARLGKQGPARVYVDTSSTPGYQRARDFYEKNGYAAICILKDFYRDNDDRIIYLKKLPPAPADNGRNPA